MTDPERIESGLGDLLRRTNWQGPAPTDPEPLGTEEHARWRSLMDEPAQALKPARRMPIGLIGATGLVAAVLVVAVGINSVRNGQRSQPVGESVAPRPRTPARPLSRSEPVSESAPKTVPEATPRPEPVKVLPPPPMGLSLKPATTGIRTTTIPSAPGKSGAPAIQPPAPAPSPIAPQRAKASRPLQSRPAASKDESQIGSVSVPDSDSRSSANILDEVNITATRRANRAADSTPTDAVSSRAYSERQQVAKSSAAGAPLPSEQRVNTTGMAAISTNRLELVSSELETTAATSLRTQLATIDLPAGFSGEVVFELVVEAGRVRDFRLIEADSTIKDPAVIDPIRGRLLAWTPPPTTNPKSRIVLRVQP